jgi:multidrug efflux pump subunit AcrB
MLLQDLSRGDDLVRLRHTDTRIGDCYLMPRAAFLGQRRYERRSGLRDFALRLHECGRGSLRLRNKFSVIAVAICTIVIGFGFYKFIGSEMMPLADVGQAYGVLELAPGSSYAQTQEAATALEKIMLKHPEIERVSTEIGEEPGGGRISPGTR